MKETNITIISNNLNDAIINDYKNYLIIDNNFSYEEILKSKKVLFWCVLDNLDNKELERIFNFLKSNDIKFINVTNNLETSLYTDYLICYDKEKIIIEGNTLDVLSNAKLLKRLGFELPFMVDLSLLLKDYGLINRIYLDKESLVDELWK